MSFFSSLGSLGHPSRTTGRFVIPACLMTALLLGCPPNPDEDRDGLADRYDACPLTSPQGSEILFKGCSLSDLILSPQALSDPLQEQMDTLAGAFSDEPVLDEVLLAFDDAATGLADGANALLAADPCEAAVRFQDAQAPLALASQVMDVFLADLQVLANATEAPGGDVDEISSQALWWRARALEVDELSADAVEAGRIVDGMCSSIASYDVVEGRVVETDPTLHAFVLDDGQRVIIAPKAVYAYSLTEGVQVSADVLRFVDGTTITDYGTITWPAVTGLPGIWDGECLQLTAVPWGGAPPGGEHDLAGYRDGGGVYQLEDGMRLRATGDGCPDPDPDHPWMKYGFRLTLSYAGGTQSVILASAMHRGDQAWLPSYVDPNEVAQLTLEKFRMTCERDPLSIIGASKCGNEVPIHTVVLPIQINSRFTFCEAVYDATSFDLPPHDYNVFQQARVTGVVGAPGPVTFHAEARKVVNGQSSYIQEIGLNEAFAVHRIDFLFGPHGTSHEAAIRWPHVIGSRNGEAYQYACSVPELIRDRISMCVGPDTFYRLPFANNQGTSVGQGNNTPWDGMGTMPSHAAATWQRWALDLGGSIGTDLVAAREGVVRLVQSNITTQCIDGLTVPGGNACPSFFGNYVAIEHAGGQWSWYMHMDPGSATVSPGQTVQRGQKIGEVGLTGNTTGPHVHFQVTPGNTTSATSQVSYEMYPSAPPTNPVACVVPQVGNTYWSNNAP